MGKQSSFFLLGASLIALLVMGAGCAAGQPTTNQSGQTADNSTTPVVVTEQNASIDVSNQPLPKEWLMVKKIISPAKGWVVIHQLNDGKIGPDIGYAAVTAGDNYNVGVKIDPGQATEQLTAMLHFDYGQEGVYEITGADQPMMWPNGKPVTQNFTLLNFKKVEPPVSSGSGVQVVREFNITAKKWAFSPNTIVVKKGDHVRLKITSTDANHGFALPDFNIKIDLAPNSTQIVELEADKVGTFPFFCSVFCGEGHGNMTGQLIVK